MALKFALLSIWHSHTVLHVRDAFQRPDEFKLAGIYEPDVPVREAKLRQWAQEYPAADLSDIRIFETVEEAVSSDVDAILCEGRVFENLDFAEQALAAGKHVLLEKPAGVHLDQLERLHRMAQDNNLHLQMAYMWRYNTAIHEIIRLSRAGAFGDVFYFRGHIPKPLSYFPRLVEELDRYKGSLYFEMAGHLVDIMVSIMGEPRQTQSNHACDYGDRKHVDNAVVVYQFDRGLGTIDAASMHVESGETRRIEVYGTRGTAIHTPIGSNNLTLYLKEPFEDYAAGKTEQVRTAPPGPPSLLTELAACIVGEKNPDYTLAHDMQVQRALFAGCGITDATALVDVPHSSKKG